MLCLLDSFILNKKPLSLVPLASPTPLQDHGGKTREFPGASRQCSIAGGQEYEVIEVSACKAERALVPVQHDPGVLTEVLCAFTAFRFASGDEHFQIVLFPVRHFRIPHQANNTHTGEHRPPETQPA